MDEIIHEYPEYVELQCPVCHDFFWYPKTLWCQHSVCNECIESHFRAIDDDDSNRYHHSHTYKLMYKCPVCKCETIVPANHNTILQNLVESLIPQEKTQKKREEMERDMMTRELKEEVVSELCKEAWRTNMGIYLRDKTEEYARETLVGIDRNNYRRLPMHRHAPNNEIEVMNPNEELDGIPIITSRKPEERNIFNQQRPVYKIAAAIHWIVGVCFLLLFHITFSEHVWLIAAAWMWFISGICANITNVHYPTLRQMRENRTQLCMR